jgi:hypothetical protein
MPENSARPFEDGETIFLWENQVPIGELYFSGGQLHWRRQAEWLSENGQGEVERQILAGRPACGLEGHLFRITRL